MRDSTRSSSPATVPHEISREAQQRVKAAYTCVVALRPELGVRAAISLAERVLDLCSAFPAPSRPTPRPISAAQVTEMIWRHSQCIHPHCPMVIFADRLAQELNTWMQQKE